jgi:hypothetical protein
MEYDFEPQPVEPETTIQFWLDNLRERADIFNGNLRLSESGFLTVSESPVLNSVYVDVVMNRFTPVVQPGDWRGRPYKFRGKDCVALAAEWLDSQYDIGAVEYVKAINRNEYIRLNLDGYLHMLQPLGFEEVSQPAEVGDIVVYIRQLHIGVCIEPGKILHHMPYLYSSIDTIDPNLVLGVFRRG